MAPLSILPGRVRYADSRLIGNESLACHLESRICQLPGIRLVSASHRTGRVLVEFNECHVSRDDLAQRINSMLSDAPCHCRWTTGALCTPVARGKHSPFAPDRILADMALHLILPAPFDLLLPALRRS